MAEKLLDVKVTKSPDLVQLMQAFKNWPKKQENIIQGSGAIVIREYKKEVPVDKGEARKRVKLTKNKEGYVVTTTATRNGVLYPLMVHDGTMDYKGDSTDYGARGRAGAVRGRTNKRVKRRGAFNYIDANRGKKGIRPNKFADRARIASVEPIVQFISDKIDKELGIK